jgi:MoaA/NifB/PqqE/SkfB family radical SAM enzyme
MQRIPTNRVRGDRLKRVMTTPEAAGREAAAEAERLPPALRWLGTPVRSFNVEITNRCTLGCPECSRTNNPWVRRNLTQLPVELLQRVFPLAERERFEGVKINLCGTYGDCIYHTRFHDVIAHFKAAGLSVMIETNGSHRTAGWWRKTCALLGDDDAVTFSVDGLEDTNHLYRINSRWSDIIAAMEYCAPRVYVSWKFIVFRHNEHQIEQAKALAGRLGVRDITFKKSARFREDDPLAPNSGDYIGVVNLNRRAIRETRAAGLPAAELDHRVSIRQNCYSGKGLAITALGYLYPCTNCESADTATWFYQNREHFNLRKHALRQILASPKWGELQRLWRRASTTPGTCAHTCGVHRDFDQRYSRAARQDRPNKPDDVMRVVFG